jgi:hypothetical protein
MDPFGLEAQSKMEEKFQQQNRELEEAKARAQKYAQNFDLSKVEEGIFEQELGRAYSQANAPLYMENEDGEDSYYTPNPTREWKRQLEEWNRPKKWDLESQANGTIFKESIMGEIGNQSFASQIATPAKGGDSGSKQQHLSNLLSTSKPGQNEQRLLDSEKYQEEHDLKKGVCRIIVQIDFKGKKDEFKVKMHATLPVSELKSRVHTYMERQLHYHPAAHGTFQIHCKNRALKETQSVAEQVDISETLNMWTFFEAVEDKEEPLAP